MNEFFRFPHTPHLTWLGSALPRNDKVLSPVEVQNLLSADVTVEEKLDGANLGVSVENDGQLRFQNRGEYLVPPFNGQFARLGAWAGQHSFNLVPQLGPNLILFGEWCAARHSVVYDALPDWFVAFDIFDRAARKFWSVQRRNALVRRIGIPVIPSLYSGPIALDDLILLATTRDSQFGKGSLEGLVVRRDGREWLEQRAKLVRPDFIQAIGEHWRRRKIEWNRIKTS